MVIWQRTRAAKPQGNKAAVISPLALEAVRRIDARFEIADDQRSECRKSG
jgi:hypothetical protein